MSTISCILWVLSMSLSSPTTRPTRLRGDSTCSNPAGTQWNLQWNDTVMLINFLEVCMDYRLYPRVTYMHILLPTWDMAHHPNMAGTFLLGVKRSAGEIRLTRADGNPGCQHVNRMTSKYSDLPTFTHFPSETDTHSNLMFSTISWHGNKSNKICMLSNIFLNLGHRSF